MLPGDGTWFSREAGYILAGATTVPIWLAPWRKAGRCGRQNSPGAGQRTPPGSPIPASSTNAGSTRRPPATHPLTAADYLDYPRMRAVMVALNNTPDGALLPSGNYDVWDVVPAVPRRFPAAKGAPRAPFAKSPYHSLFHQPRGWSA